MIRNCCHMFLLLPLGFCHCWGDAEPGIGVFCRGGWAAHGLQVRDDVGWFCWQLLIFLPLLSYWKIQHPPPETGISMWLAASPDHQNVFWFHKTVEWWSLSGSWSCAFLLQGLVNSLGMLKAFSVDMKSQPLVNSRTFLKGDSICFWIWYV